MNSPRIASAASHRLFRTEDDPAVWPHRGQVAAVGIGHSPTLRRWDGSDPGSSVGGWTLLAIRKAIADAGVAPEDVDGIVFCPDTNTLDYWPADKPIPQGFLDAFQQTDDPMDGLVQLSAEWLIANLPELSNLKFVYDAPMCMSMCVAAAIEAVGQGHGEVVLAVKGWHALPGRYSDTGWTQQVTVSGPPKYRWITLSGGPTCTWTATHFQRYLHKYGGSHNMLAPFVVNAHRNGLMMPEGYWAQHKPGPFTTEDYLNSRWIAEPCNLYDNDIPIHTSAAFLFTTAERAKDMVQPPVYVLGHASGGRYDRNGDYTGFARRSSIESLEEMQEWSTRTADRLYKSSGIGWQDVHFQNANEGFTPFHVLWVEGFNFFGVKEGECLDFFQTDISIEGNTPCNTGGGNLGNGRTRYWMWTDTIQQLQGRAGARQMKMDARVGVAGGFTPYWSNFAALSKDPV